MIKNNACFKSFNCHQILSTIGLILSIIGFILLCIPGYKLYLKLVSISLQSFAIIMLLIFLIRAAISNTTDPLILLYHTFESTNNLDELFREVEKNVDLYSYCTICNCFVNKNSKHCKACNSCTADFDHHCKWINNCVAKNNYLLFIGTLICLLAYCANAIGWGIYSCVRYNSITTEFRNNIKDA